MSFWEPAQCKEFYKSIKHKQNILGLEHTPPSTDRQFKTATKLSTYIEMESVPFLELSSLAENIHGKNQKASKEKQGLKNYSKI